MKYLIDDNGIIREMTPEEIAAWEAECAEFTMQQMMVEMI